MNSIWNEIYEYNASIWKPRYDYIHKYYPSNVSIKKKFWRQSKIGSQLRVLSRSELWKIFSVDWVHDDFKLLLRLKSEESNKLPIGQTNESIY